MEEFREVVAYKNHFEDFLKSQPLRVQVKIYKIIEIIEYQQFIPNQYLKHIEGTDGLYEARISLSRNLWRIFCFFDDGKLIILLNGFQKKTQKTAHTEIDKALKLRVEYYSDKKHNK
jgi:phage-related protein